MWREGLIPVCLQIFNNYEMKGRGICALAYPNGGEDVDRNKLLAPSTLLGIKGHLETHHRISRLVSVCVCVYVHVNVCVRMRVHTGI